MYFSLLSPKLLRRADPQSAEGVGGGGGGEEDVKGIKLHQEDGGWFFTNVDNRATWITGYLPQVN